MWSNNNVIVITLSCVAGLGVRLGHGSLILALGLVCYCSESWFWVLGLGPMVLVLLATVLVGKML
jgi:hypothetical protein